MQSRHPKPPPCIIAGSRTVSKTFTSRDSAANSFYEQHEFAPLSRKGLARLQFFSQAWLGARKIHPVFQFCVFLVALHILIYLAHTPQCHTQNRWVSSWWWGSSQFPPLRPSARSGYMAGSLNGSKVEKFSSTSSRCRCFEFSWSFSSRSNILLSYMRIAASLVPHLS